MKFKVGDTVTREVDVYDQKSPLMHGMVIEVYSDHKSRFGPYPELYKVRWDNGVVGKSYLPHGLDHDCS